MLGWFRLRCTVLLQQRQSTGSLLPSRLLRYLLAQPILTLCKGNTCGLASGFESYPYLYFADVDDLNHTVCVKTCPDWEEDEQSPDNIDCKPNDQVRDCKLSQVDIYRTFECKSKRRVSV